MEQDVRSLVGKIVSISIDENICEAYVYRDETYTHYLFQNSYDGATPGYSIPAQYGYKYSWCVDNGTEQSLLENDVKLLNIVTLIKENSDKHIGTISLDIDPTLKVVAQEEVKIKI